MEHFDLHCFIELINISIFVFTFQKKIDVEIFYRDSLFRNLNDSFIFIWGSKVRNLGDLLIANYLKLSKTVLQKRESCLFLIQRAQYHTFNIQPMQFKSFSTDVVD